MDKYTAASTSTSVTDGEMTTSTANTIKDTSTTGIVTTVTDSTNPTTGVATPSAVTLIPGLTYFNTPLSTGSTFANTSFIPPGPSSAKITTQLEPGSSKKDDANKKSSGSSAFESHESLEVAFPVGTRWLFENLLLSLVSILNLDRFGVINGLPGFLYAPDLVKKNLVVEFIKNTYAGQPGFIDWIMCQMCYAEHAVFNRNCYHQALCRQCLQQLFSNTSGCRICTNIDEKTEVDQVILKATEEGRFNAVRWKRKRLLLKKKLLALNNEQADALLHGNFDHLIDEDWDDLRQVNNIHLDLDLVDIDHKKLLVRQAWAVQEEKRCACGRARVALVGCDHTIMCQFCLSSLGFCPGCPNKRKVNVFEAGFVPFQHAVLPVASVGE